MVEISYQPDLFSLILDSVEEEIAVIREDGTIIYVNNAWVQFGNCNGKLDEDWLGSNYFGACVPPDGAIEDSVQKSIDGIRSVINGDTLLYEYEYPCHSPVEQRWFMMRIKPLRHHSESLFVITHQNITERKIAELRVEALSLRDPLTGLSNRRHLENHLATEWLKGRRDKCQISFVIFDIDRFKSINDGHGHHMGDACLQLAAQIIGKAARRPADLAARWGGEEFILFLYDANASSAAAIAEQVRVEIEVFDFPIVGSVTVSVGVATAIPTSEDYSGLMKQADEALYAAKKSGRNKVVMA